MENQNIAEFVPLRDHDDYEILSVYPFTIKRKDNHLEVSEFNDKGYYHVYINRRKIRKHVIIFRMMILKTKLLLIILTEILQIIILIIFDGVQYQITVVINQEQRIIDINLLLTYQMSLLLLQSMKSITKIQ